MNINASWLCLYPYFSTAMRDASTRIYVLASMNAYDKVRDGLPDVRFAPKATVADQKCDLTLRAKS
jgi:hypothetical protein